MTDDVLRAGNDLRRAVRRLAATVSGTAVDAAALARAAAAVDTVVDELTDTDLSQVERAWEGPDGQIRRGIDSYRHRSPFQGALHMFAPDIEWHADASGPDGERARSCTIVVSKLFEGPPGAVHGGYVAALFDELLGGVQSLADSQPGYTGRLTVRYRRPTPIDSPIRFTGWVSKSSSLRIETHAIAESDGVTCAEADALFVRPRGSTP